MKKPKKQGNETGRMMKEVEHAVRTINLYPVAVKKEAKDAALANLEKLYAKGSDSVRQHILFLIHESIAQLSELKALQSFDYIKSKNQKALPGTVRMAVYRSMFDYTASVEGLAEFVRLLGAFKEGDEAAKLLTHILSHLLSSDSETNRMLRSAVIEALASSQSPYALRALLEYAKLTDNDKLFGRLVAALMEWGEKIDRLGLPGDDRMKLKEELQDLMAKEEKPTQYG